MVVRRLRLNVTKKGALKIFSKLTRAEIHQFYLFFVCVGHLLAISWGHGDPISCSFASKVNV